MEIIEIKSLEQYVRTVVELTEMGEMIIYRGQCIDKELKPGIIRDPMFDLEVILDRERKIMNEFKLKATPYLDFQPENELEWMAIAQHHGLKTRLLDWTENALAALWFCVDGIPYEREIGLQGVVWLLNFHDTDEYFVSKKDYTRPYDIAYTKVFRPKYISKRIIAQSGLFTLHKLMDRKKFCVPFESNNRYKEMLSKLEIKYEKFEEIKAQLISCGVNSTTLFPDMNGLSNSLNHKFQIGEHFLESTMVKLKNIKKLLNANTHKT